jgi:hypothetical protein
MRIFVKNKAKELYKCDLNKKKHVLFFFVLFWIIILNLNKYARIIDLKTVFSI